MIAASREPRIVMPIAGADVSAQTNAVCRFSVIVPVYNRSDSLRSLLEAVAAQEFPRNRFELLVCDDGSTENLAVICRESAKQLSLPICYLRQSHLGAGPARNLGIQRAAGEILAFTDSDCIPSQTWLNKLDAAFDRADLALVGGAIDYKHAKYLSGRCINYLTSTSLGGAGATDPRSILSMKYYPRTMNLAVRRSLALVVGGFSMHSRGEDLEFTHRFCSLIKGSKAVFVPNAVVVHNEQRSVSHSFVEQARRGSARIRLWCDYGLHEPVHTLPAALVISLLAIGVAEALVPKMVLTVALPLGLYCVSLVALAVHGAVALRDVRALYAIPAYAVSIHLGYGVGYLAALLRLIARAVGRVALFRWP